MRFVIVTGMSGSGKTAALKMLEDMGYFCVDNLPVELIGKFAQLAESSAQEYSKVALGLDVRSLYRKNVSAPEEVSDLNLFNESTEHPGGTSRVDDFLEIMKNYQYEILYLDCDDQTLLRRYKASRRLHPLAGEGRIEDGIARERVLLKRLRQKADYTIDTSRLLTRQMMEELSRLFSENAEGGSLFLSILSFGYKYGIPSDADLVFDVRFLPNPFYVDELKYMTGNDRRVQEYVCQNGEADQFLAKLTDLLEFLIPKYKTEGKRQLLIAVGCTGGKHRSVTVANMLSDYFTRSGLDTVAVLHRDISR